MISILFRARLPRERSLPSFNPSHDMEQSSQPQEKKLNDKPTPTVIVFKDKKGKRSIFDVSDRDDPAPWKGSPLVKSKSGKFSNLKSKISIIKHSLSESEVVKAKKKDT